MSSRISSAFSSIGLAQTLLPIQLTDGEQAQLQNCAGHLRRALEPQMA